MTCSDPEAGAGRPVGHVASSLHRTYARAGRSTEDCSTDQSFTPSSYGVTAAATVGDNSTQFDQRLLRIIEVLDHLNGDERVKAARLVWQASNI